MPILYNVCSNLPQPDVLSKTKSTHHNPGALVPLAAKNHGATGPQEKTKVHAWQVQPRVLRKGPLASKVARAWPKEAYMPGIK
eukprot:1084083-Pelagomonas_calceolata.AAC.1